MAQRESHLHLTDINAQLKVFSRAITNVKDANGKSILAGKSCTGFSNVEEEQAQMVKV